MLGPFLWGRRARVETRGAGATCTWWTGERHTRDLRVDRGRVEITDRVEGAAPVLAFPLPPGADVRLEGASATVEVREQDGRPLAAPRAMRIAAEGIANWAVEESEHASNYGRLAPALRLSAPIRGSESHVVIEVRSG
jgi:hypothetical protein